MTNKIDLPSHEMIQETRPSVEDLVNDPEMHQKIDRLMKFFDQTGVSYDDKDIDADPDFLKGLHLSDVVRKAYPNFDPYQPIKAPYDKVKWLQAVKAIFTNVRNGMSHSKAMEAVTGTWNEPEKYAFLNWLKFYKEETHLKYKTAQWYNGNLPAYFINPQKDSSKPVGGIDIDNIRDEVSNQMTASEKKNIIEQQRKKIISRLDATERLLRTEEGHIFAGKEYETLLEAIYTLKRKVQTINKLTTSSKTYTDLIIRQANILNKQGFVKAASKLYSLAEEAPKPEAQPIPAPVPPESPMTPGGMPGGLPSMGPGMPQNPPESAPNEMPPDLSKGISDFLKKMDSGTVDTSDELMVEDDFDTNHVSDELFVTEAQVIPEQPAPKPPKPIAQPEEKEPELEVDESQPQKSTEQTKDFDRIIDSALSNITIQDIIAKLEDLSRIFKVREIPRQLALVDMMLDAKSLSQYFPALSEATNKALESNNYISTRIDDILAKLHGSIGAKDIDLRGENQHSPSSAEVDALRNNLKNQDAAERRRKDLRKQQADEALEMDMAEPVGEQPKEEPEINVEKDLAEPTPPPAPIQPKPQAPPAR